MEHFGDQAGPDQGGVGGRNLPISLEPKSLTDLKAKINDPLEGVPNIDDDTIIRRYVNLIEASLRTNHFVAGKRERDQSLALKLDSRSVEGLPEPRPSREIFVYGSEV